MLRQSSRATDVPEAMAERVLVTGVFVAVAAGLLVGLSHVVNALVLDDRFFELSARSEGSVFTWMSSCAAFAAAFAAGVNALLDPRCRWRLTLVATAFAYSSLDDFAIVHERLGESLFMGSLGLSKELSSRLEILAVAPLLAAGFVAAWSVSRSQPTRVGAMLRYGLVTLAVGLALELFAGSTRLLLDGPLAWVDELRIAGEESIELAGWAIVATALTALLCIRTTEAGQAAGG